MDRLRDEEASTAPFLLEDGTARVRVEPAGTQPDFLFHSLTGVVSHAEDHLPPGDLLPHADRYQPAPGRLHLVGPLGRTMEEWIVPPGQHVWLDGVATPGPDGTVVLTRPPGGTMYLSVRPPEARARSGARTLVMSRRLRWIGIAVLALAAASLVVGAVWSGGVI